MLDSKTFYIYTLGCKVNQYESEAIAEELVRRGASESDVDKADIYIINTCTVTAESDRKSGQIIRRLRSFNPNAAILVTGCFSQISPKRASSIEGVDYVCGSADKMSVADEAERILREGKRAEPKLRLPDLASVPFEAVRISHFPRTRAYIKIEDGCNNRCSYCIIPKARGPVRSRDPEDIIAEIDRLTDAGCPEIVLTGIETEAYGIDFDNGYRLAELVEDICKRTTVSRIRLGSVSPALFTDDFVDRICTLPQMLPHYHISLQSGCSRTLAEMKRRYNAHQAHTALSRIRAARPDVQFSADLIVGFPGETEEDISETLAFLKEERFLSLHVFPYSMRAGTLAAQRTDQIEKAEKKARFERVSAQQERIKHDILSEYIGKAVSVLFEETVMHEGKEYLCGHTPFFAQTYIESDKHHQKGTIISVSVHSVKDGILFAKESADQNVTPKRRSHGRI